MSWGRRRGRAYRLPRARACQNVRGFGAVSGCGAVRPRPSSSRISTPRRIVLTAKELPRRSTRSQCLRAQRDVSIRQAKGRSGPEMIFKGTSSCAAKTRYVQPNPSGLNSRSGPREPDASSVERPASNCTRVTKGVPVSQHDRPSTSRAEAAPPRNTRARDNELRRAVKAPGASLAKAGDQDTCLAGNSRSEGGRDGERQVERGQQRGGRRHWHGENLRISDGRKFDVIMPRAVSFRPVSQNNGPRGILSARSGRKGGWKNTSCSTFVLVDTPSGLSKTPKTLLCEWRDVHGGDVVERTIGAAGRGKHRVA